MIDTTITDVELGRHLAETLDRVQTHGERITVARGGEPIAVLAPVHRPAAPRVTWRQVVEHLRATGIPGEGFSQALDEAQASQPHAEPPAWPS